MTELILIRGLPGSGKSTFAKMLSDLIFGTHIETDMFFANYAEGYKFDAKELPVAHKWAQDWCRHELEDGYDVIVSNTFSRVWEMQPYLDMAKELEVKVTVLTMEGNYGSVHNVPQSSIDKMKRRWEKYPSDLFGIYGVEIKTV